MNFKSWCQEMWYNHIDEMVSVTGKPPCYTAKDYFTKYKWWLKREYKFQNCKQP